MSQTHLKKGSKFPPKIGDGYRLYSMKYCPYAQRVRLILDLKNIPYELVNISIFNKPEWIFELNPLGQVPILDTGSTILTESLIICNYLEKMHSEPSLLPKTKQENDRDSDLLKEYDVFLSIFYRILKHVGVNDFEPLLTYVSKFETELKKRGKYFGGEDPRMIDFMLWPWAERAPMFTELFGDKVPDASTYPHLHSWCKAMRKNPNVQNTQVNVQMQSKIFEQIRQGVTDIDFDV